MDNAEKTIRKIKELVTRQSEIEALERMIEFALSDIERLKKEVNELSAKYDSE